MATSPLSHLKPEPVSAATFSAFAEYPWCTQLLNDQRYTPVRPYHFRTSADLPNDFMTGVLYNSGNFIANQSLYFRISNKQGEESDEDPGRAQGTSRGLTGELVTLWVLGSGFSGWKGLAHGGLSATLLDQQAGNLIVADPATTSPRTAYFNIRYARAIPVPGAVKVSAWKTRVEGKKHWVTAELTNGKGQVLVSADVLFINGNPKL